LYLCHLNKAVINTPNQQSFFGMAPSTKIKQNKTQQKKVIIIIIIKNQEISITIINRKPETEKKSQMVVLVQKSQNLNTVTTVSVLFVVLVCFMLTKPCISH